MASEAKELPGSPSPDRVKSVRRFLKTYLNASPPRLDRCWLLTWEWAANVAGSYLHKNWPSAKEIAVQWLILKLSVIRSDHVGVKLPARALSEMPLGVKQQLADGGMMRAPGIAGASEARLLELSE